MKVLAVQNVVVTGKRSSSVAGAVIAEVVAVVAVVAVDKRLVQQQQY